MASSLSASGKHVNLVKQVGDSGESWVLLQKKAFTAWVNEHLRDRKLFIKELDQDLQNGVNLCHLMEILSGHEINRGKWVRTPKTRFDALQNVSQAFQFITRQSIKLVAIGPEDLVDPKLKLILGLIWLLILRYHISKGGGGANAKNDLIAWIRKRTEKYGVECKDFSAASWGDGRLYVGLVHSFQAIPDLDPTRLAPGDALKNVTAAMAFAEKELGVPHILDPEDLLRPEELSMMTYIGFLRNAAPDQPEANGSAPSVRASGEGLQRAVVGKAAKFDVSVSPAAALTVSGPRIQSPAGEIEISISGPAGPLSPALSAEKNAVGVSYTPERLGKHKIEVKAKGSPVAGSPWTVDAGSSASAAHSTAAGPGLERPLPGKPAEFVVTLRDAAGTPLSVGGDEVKVSVDTKNGALVGQPSASDSRNGTYAACYFPEKAGDYAVAVAVNGSPIKGSPFLVKVSDTVAPDAAKSTLQLSTAAPVVGSPVALVLTALNNDGTPASVTAAQVGIKAAGPRGQTLPAQIEQRGAGVFDVRLTPSVPGTVTITGTLDGQAVSPGPVEVRVRPNSSAQHSTAAGPGLEKPVARAPAPFTVQVLDAGGAKVSVGGDVVAVEVTSPTGSLKGQPTVADNEDGTYQAAYHPLKAGDYKVAVTLNGQPIRGSPFAVRARDTVDAAKSALSVEPAAPVATQPVLVKLVARNADGEAVAEGGAEVASEITGPTGERVTAEVKDHGDGTYSAPFTPAAPGRYHAAFRVGGSAVPAQPLPVDVRSEASAAHSTAAGPGLERPATKQPARFTVQVRNGKGQPLSAGGDNVTVTVDTKNGRVDGLPAVSDNKDGTYSASYLPLLAGDYAVAVLLNGEPIKGSPFSARALDPVDPAKSSVSVESAKPVPDQPVQLKLTSKASDGTPISVRDSDVAVVILGPNGEKLRGELKEAGDGALFIAFTPPGPGAYTADVRVAGVSVTPTPVAVLVKPDSSAAHTTAAGPGLERPRTRAAAPFVVTVNDSAGKRVRVGGDQVRVEVTPAPGGRLGGEPSVRDNGDGTYAAEYRPESPADYSVQVTLNGQPIRGSPFAVRARDTVDAAKSTLSVEPAAPVATQPVLVKLVARNADGEAVAEGGEEVVARVTAPTGPEPKVEVTDQRDGTYIIRFTPTAPGKHAAAVSVNGSEVAASPLAILVRPNTSGAASSAQGPGLEQPVAGQPTQFTVQAKDAAGRKVDVGGDRPEVALIAGATKDKIPAEITDNGDGSYTVRYAPLKQGPLTADVALNGEAVKGSPFHVTVRPRVDGRRSRVSGEGVKSAVAKRKAQFAVEVLDGEGKPVDDLPLEVTIRSPAEEIAPVITKGAAGKSDVEYVAAHPGEITISIAVDGVPIADSPYVVKVKPGAAPKKTAVTRWMFTIECKDDDGNSLADEVSDLNVQIQAPDGSSVPAKLSHSILASAGVYTLEFVPAAKGEYVISVTIAGEHIAGSPFKSSHS